jgi:hypothetical protein
LQASLASTPCKPHCKAPCGLGYDINYGATATTIITMKMAIILITKKFTSITKSITATLITTLKIAKLLNKQYY